MKSRIILYAGAGLALLLWVGCGNAENSGGEMGQDRPPAVAGQFYPADGGKLRLAVEDFIRDARTLDLPKPFALVAPHAGYTFSGQIAADAWRQVQGRGYKLVIILGTNHTSATFTGVSVYAAGGFQTPLGVAKIDAEAAKELLKADDRFTFDREVHRREHSVEVQIPFFQVVLPGVKILPLVIGSPDPDLCRTLGEAIGRLFKDRNVLLVASSDLSHYPTYEDAISTDRENLRALATLDPDKFTASINKQMSSQLPNLATCACGQGPILTAMYAAKAVGATRAVIVSSANSGDAVLGDPDRVVGYGAVVFTTGKPEPTDLDGLPHQISAPKSGSLNEAKERQLLRLARESVTRFLTTETTPLPRFEDPSLSSLQGAFVTLTERGQLRGCIGHMAEDTPLCRVIGMMALQSAEQDHRFAPVTVEELPEIEFEISVLTPIQPVSNPDEIVLGRDGVVIKKSGRSAVYLPQVAPEQGWNLEQTLDHLCEKAGLSQGSWRQGAELFTFQAQVFSESKIH